MTKLYFTINSGTYYILQITKLLLALFEKENTDELGQSTSTFANHV